MTNNHKQKRILICGGTGCLSTGALDLQQEFLSILYDIKRAEEYSVILTGCHGFCEQGPVVIIETDNTFYCQVKTEDIKEIVDSHLIKGFVVERLLYLNPVTKKRVRKHEEINFYQKQQRILLNLCGKIDPEQISEYIQHDGYMALKQALQLEPQAIIEEIKVSNLRGRGGGGFSTGLKWEYTRNSSGDCKYIICNADEGDPGAFMDRSLIEGNPHSIIEGMVIAGYAIGSNKGYIYVRAEYPLAVKRLLIAIAQAKENGFLGENICDTNFSFNLTIKEGAGAFVCGESSALMQSIEGNRGNPRSRPPNSTKKGLWGQPTCLNNVETFANIPVILNMGGQVYKKIGTEGSSGTKVLALTGKVNNTGLAEVPMGISLRDVIFDIGGGITKGKAFKAVQIGGPSGGCLPEELLDLPIDFDSLEEAGAMMGSGGIVVLDETTCMVNLAKFFLEFTQNESCGKCTPCREGTYHMLQILERITKGNSTIEDINRLENISHNVIKTSLCGLGKSAPNPILSTLRYFRHEYESHIIDKRCPSGTCKDLVKFSINSDTCKACTICLKHCPASAIIGKRGETHYILQDQCTTCGICHEKCPFQAIEIK